MSKNLFYLISHLRRALALCLCLAFSAAAQHTSVEKNGVGGRIETDHNAAGKPTEMRTIGADGKLQQKVDYQYLPGYYGAQQTDTTYWPNSKVRKIVRHTYDASTNFTGEFAEAFDDSGNQLGGHKLTHDPWTGVYRCSEWKLGAQKYQPVTCPSGEEESGGAKEEPHTFTYDEVMKNLEAARKAAQQEQATRLARPAFPSSNSSVASQPEVGLVLPAHVQSGEQISGSIVNDPDDYEDMPEVAVTRIALPVANSASALSGWQFQIDGEKPQPADAPFTFLVPSHSSTLNVVLRQAGDPEHAVSKTVTLRLNSSKASLPNSFQVSPLCLKGQLCVLTGPFSGDSTKTFTSFDNRPANIIAETHNTACLRVPDATAPGPRTILLAEGSKVVALPVIIGELVIKGNGRELKAGDTLIASPTLDGPGDLPDTAWEGNYFPAASLEMARHFIPGFHLPKHNRTSSNEKAEPAEKGESDDKGGGEILMVVKNAAPQSTSVRASTNNLLIFHLSEQSFERGDFKYDVLIQAQNAGKVNLRGYVIPFLAHVAGQEFDKK